MIRHVYERVSAVFADCFVATDDDRIVATVEQFGGRAVMTSGHHRSGTDRCAEALGTVSAMTGKRYDVVVNIQGDEPFIEPVHLRALSALFNDTQAEVGTLVARFGEGEEVLDANTPKVVRDREGYALYFSRSVIPFVREMVAEETVVYYKHIGLYAYRSDVLKRISAMPPGVLERAESLEQLRWLENGLRIKTAEVKGMTIAVDTPEDLGRAENFYRSKL